MSIDGIKSIPRRSQVMAAEQSIKALTDYENGARNAASEIKRFLREVSVEALRNNIPEHERVGTVLIDEKNSMLFAAFHSSLQNRSTLFSHWLLTRQPLLKDETARSLSRQIFCLCLQRFRITPEIAEILEEATKLEKSPQTNLDPCLMYTCASRLETQLQRQREQQDAEALEARTTFTIASATDAHTLCCNFDGTAFDASTDRALEKFMKSKERLQSSDTIIKRPRARKDDVQLGLTKPCSKKRRRASGK